MIADSINQLQPCPFCGGSASFVANTETMHIKCDGCGLKSPEQAIKKHPNFSLENSRLWAHDALRGSWNRRSGEKKITTKFIVEHRDTYKDRNYWADSKGQWQSHHTVEYPPNPSFPPEYNAKKLARNRLEQIKVPEEEDDDGCYDDTYDSGLDTEGPSKLKPIPIFSEYRIIRVTKTKEVIEYGNSEAGGPVYQKDPDLLESLRKEKQRDIEFKIMMAECDKKEEEKKARADKGLPPLPCQDCNDEGCDPCGAVIIEGCIC